MGSGVYMWVKISFIFYSKVFVFLFVFIKSKFFLENIVNSVMTQYFHLVNCHPKNSRGQAVPLTITVLEPQAPLTTAHAHAHTHTHCLLFILSSTAVDLVSLFRPLNFMTKFHCLFYLSVFFPRWQVF